MKKTSMIVLLVTLALLLALPACRLPASTPAVTPTGGAGEVPFPVDPTPTTGSVAEFGTQTAIAQTPAGDRTPQVIVNTPTVAAGGEAGGGQAEATTPGTDANQGGGQGGQAAQPSATQLPPAANVPAVPAQRPTTYTLERGEWPICIARRFDLDLATFLSQNGLNMNSKPLAGTTLTIPSTGNWGSTYGARTLKSHPVDYTVAAGDTVNTIACQFGDVDPNQILLANGIQASDIQPGRTIRIP